MSRPDERTPIRTQQWLRDQWRESLGDVLESMTGQRPSSEWSGTRESSPFGEMLWWEQEFTPWAGPSAWVGLPQEVWNDLGSRTLRAAGLEEVALADSRSTCLEILSQAFSGFAKRLSDGHATEVNSSTGGECSGPPASSEPFSLVLQFPDGSLPPLRFAFLPVLWEDPGEAMGNAGVLADQGPRPAAVPKTLDLLLDMKLAVSVSFGRKRMPLQDILKLTAGSVVELDRGVDDPVELIVNNAVVAYGEVIVVDGNYGVRIQQIVSREKRLHSNCKLRDLA